MKFVKFVGETFLCGMAVVMYRRDDGNLELRAETAGGKRAVKSYRNEETGRKYVRAVPALVLTDEQYEDLIDEWREGTLPGDVRVTQRALEHLGVG